MNWFLEQLRDGLARLPTAVFLLIVTALFIGAMAFQKSEYEKLNVQYEKLDKEEDSLRSQVQSLNDEIAGLKKGEASPNPALSRQLRRLEQRTSRLEQRPVAAGVAPAPPIDPRRWLLGVLLVGLGVLVAALAWTGKGGKAVILGLLALEGLGLTLFSVDMDKLVSIDWNGSAPQQPLAIGFANKGSAPEALYLIPFANGADGRGPEGGPNAQTTSTLRALANALAPCVDKKGGGPLTLAVRGFASSAPYHRERRAGSNSRNVDLARSRRDFVVGRLAGHLCGKPACAAEDAVEIRAEPDWDGYDSMTVLRPLGDESGVDDDRSPVEAMDRIATVSIGKAGRCGLR
jgi:cell division protein FtsB